MSKLISLITAAALLAAGLAASATAQAASLADIAIIDRSTGERLNVWRHDGRLYVAGRPGNRYSVELANRTGERVLTVVSVDGVNVLSGETASTRQSGYVLNPSERFEILGWRKSMEDVAAFYFTRLPDSYAARTGRPQNVGVIGLAVYREYLPPPQPALEMNMAPPSAPRLAQSDSSGADKSKATAGAARRKAFDAAGAVAQSRQEDRLGTGHGERLASNIIYTDFRRASERPAEVIAIYYDSYTNLLAQGVIPTGHAIEPRPFPGPFADHFVPDPRY